MDSTLKPRIDDESPYNSQIYLKSSKKNMPLREDKTVNRKNDERKKAKGIEGESPR